MEKEKKTMKIEDIRELCKEAHKDDIARPGEMMADMGIVEENNIKMLDV